MLCPRCKSAETRVVDSRSGEGGKSIRRRRECERCKHRFTTFERLEEGELVVRKVDGRSELYSREKLERGIWLSCGKRPITREQVDEMIGKLEEKWIPEKEIASKNLGLDVMNALRELDDIAYIRFASVYREFHDVEDFQKEIQKLFIKQKEK